MLSQTGFSAVSVPAQFKITSSIALTFSQVNDKCIVAHHNITDGEIGVGHPIDHTDAAQLVNTLVEQKRVTSGWVDSRVIFESDKHLAWYRQADTTNTSLWFRIDSKPSIEVCAKLPTLIFIRSKNASTTTVFACIGNQRPTPETKLYCAPLFNTGEFGAFCLGSATVPVGLMEASEMISGTENAIFDSVFTHSNQSNTFSKKHGDTITNKEHLTIWQDFAKRNERPKKADLTPMKHTLSDIINAMEK